MRKEKVGLVALSIIVSSWCVSSSCSRGDLSRGKAPVTFGSPSSSLALNRVGSSIVFPLHGDVFPTGSYYTTLYVGQPPKPYFLDPDTGTDLTWLQCNVPCARRTPTPHPPYVPTGDLIMCRDPICVSLHSSGDYKCDQPEQCDYEVEYADGGSSRGVLVKDVFSFKSYDGGDISRRVALGCGCDQTSGSSAPFLDGVLGLGKGESSIVSQLSSQGLVPNVLGHCLSARGGGFLFFGDDPSDSSGIMWTPMSRDYSEHYSPGTAELLYAGEAIGPKNLLLVFDSGSTYTYFSSQAYQALIFEVKKDLKGKPFTEASGDMLPLCWSCTKPFKNIRDVRKYFKPFALSFSGGGRNQNQFEVPPESYLIISSKGNVCMGVLNGTAEGLENMNVIGDISMQDKMVIYDNERQLMGWSSSSDCSRLPKSRAIPA